MLRSLFARVCSSGVSKSHGLGSRSGMTTSPTMRRRLRLQPLEDRRLLSVSPIDDPQVTPPDLIVPIPEPSAGSWVSSEELSVTSLVTDSEGLAIVPPTYDPLAPALGATFAGIDYVQNGTTTGAYHIPPDPIGAAGPNHVVNVVNTSIEWYSKTGTIGNRQSLLSFFTSLSPTTSNKGVFDPKVIYDQHANRFVVVTLDRNDATSTSRILVAVSDDSDPNGTWYYQSINGAEMIGGTNHWADYPGLAVDSQGVYITNNMFPFGGGAFGGSRLWIMDKGLYSGGSSTVNKYDPSTLASVGWQLGTLQPAHIFGTAPAGVGTYLVANGGYDGSGNDYYSVIQINSPLSSPTFVHTSINLGNVTTGFYLPDAPQLGTASLIETNDGRALHAVWRNNSLWATNTVEPPSGPDTGQATAHWAEINTTTFALVQQGDVGGEDVAVGTHTFFPSIAVDGAGNMGIGFAASASSIYPGAYYTGRLSTDTAGTVQSTSTLAAGTDFYLRTFGSGRNRWGDYSGISIDPSDDTTFWVYNQYAMTRGTGTAPEDGRWATQWGSFTFTQPTTYDYGDAPDPTYPTKSTSSGAAHVIVAGPYLGNATDSPDADPDGQPHPNALGDDNDGNDDENGVVVPPMLPGHSSAVTIEVNGVPGGAAAKLDAWIDFDGNGNWDASEHLFAGVSATIGANGTIVIPFSVPASAVAGTTFGRFRISTQGGLSPLGVASDGEVEDHEVTILEQPEGTKWIQWPDLSPNGIDVRATTDAPAPMTLADDWLCEEESLLTDVHLWGSWLGDQVGLIENLHLSVHSDDPVGAGGSNPNNLHSTPDELLWEMDFSRDLIDMTEYYVAPEVGEYWWDPVTETLIPNADRTVWKLDVDIDPASAFRQMGTPNDPTIYWLDVSVKTTTGEFGWKTRQYPDHFMDDAVWQGDDPAVWSDMSYPSGHPYVVDEASIDLAFMLTFQPPQDKWVQWPDTTPNGIDVKATTEPDGTRIVLADDWECTEPSLLTDVHLWGSWLHDDVGTIENLHLSVHSDDPVGPGGSLNDNQYSMPDLLLWEMDFATDDIGMSQYFTLPDIGEYWWDPTDPDPGTALIPNADRTIWQVDVLIDPSQAFYQEGTPENPTIYWLDVNVKTTENTEFGWKTRRHPDHFNDDAVWHYDGLAAPYWNEMRYPQGHPYEDDPQNSMDMAFMLTFEPPPEELDWGDAPDAAAAAGYPTLSGNSGASHIIGGPWLGDTSDVPDSEPDGQPDPAALGDDNDGNDDEDGVNIPVLVQGQQALVTFEVNGVSAGAAAWVDGWIDFNGDQTWDASELIVSGAYGNGTHNIAVTPPATAAIGATFARFRINTAGALPPTGPAADGEVEDHEVFIEEGPRNLDWGDAPDGVLAAGYPTLAANNGASHVITTLGPWLGPGPLPDNRDAEFDGQPDPAALGDDNDGNDDENGVTFSVLIAGDTGTFSIDVGNGGGYVDGWIDFNGDGIWDDTAGSIERVVGPGLIVPLQYTSSFTVPAGAVVGQTFARFRVNTVGNLPPTGPATDGEVEDYEITILPEDTPLDFGDAPDGIAGLTYPTLKVNDGARHYPTGPTLGAVRDSEADGQPTVPADGDDLAGSPDDEDGILNTSIFAPGLKGAWIEVDASGPSYLNAWIDFNGNMVWESGEKVAGDVLLGAGMNLLTFDVPLSAIPGQSYARLRLTSYDTGGSLSPTGLAYDGEVEDHRLFIENDLYFEGTSADNIIEVWAGVIGTTLHQVDIDGWVTTYDPAVYDAIYVDGLAGSDTITTHGTPANENAALSSSNVSVTSSTYGIYAQSVETINVDAVTGANDQVLIAGSTGSNRLYSYAGYCRLSDSPSTFSYRVDGFDDVTVNAPIGGRNYAFLYDSPQDDDLNADPTQVVFDRAVGTADATTTTITGFGRVYSYGTNGGTDDAVLAGSATTSNRLYSYPDYSILTESRRSFYFYTRGFETVTGNSTAAVTTYAYLYDSTGNDACTASPTSAGMDRASTWSDATANGFKRVYAYSTRGGTDTAALAGNSTGGNRYRAYPTYSTLTDTARSFYHYVRGFRTVTATGSIADTTSDRAYLYDSPGDDTLFGLHNQCYLEDTAASVYHNEALYFDYIYARSTDDDATTDDTVTTTTLAFNLILSGTW